VVHELSGHPACNPISAGSHGTWYLCTLLESLSSSLSVCAAVCGVVVLASCFRLFSVFWSSIPTACFS